jgi:hypothetical protein
MTSDSLLPNKKLRQKQQALDLVIAAFDPICRTSSAQSLTLVEYRITRCSLSSRAHSRDPLAGDDGCTRDRDQG